MQGQIQFVTIDLREHPEYQRNDGPKKPFAIDHAPYVWVYLVVYDRDGKEVTRNGGGVGDVYGLTKQAIIQKIRWACSGAQQRPLLCQSSEYIRRSSFCNKCEGASSVRDCPSTKTNWK